MGKERKKMTGKVGMGEDGAQRETGEGRRMRRMRAQAANGCQEQFQLCTSEIAHYRKSPCLLSGAGKELPANRICPSQHSERRGFFPTHSHISPYTQKHADAHTHIL